MRKLLLLALLLYNIVAKANRQGGYDYDDTDLNKRHSFLDDRRNWRKKSLEDHKDWENRRRHEYDPARYTEDTEAKIYEGLDRQRDIDVSSQYRNFQQHYEDDKRNMQQAMKSAESGHPSTYLEKEPERKSLMTMSCDRPHERYEPCFAGCAAVTCDNPRDRLRPCYPFCEPGCICLQPYVRDDRTHKCVLPDDCTKGLKGIPDFGDDI